MDNLTEILEAILFASGSARTKSELLNAFNGEVNKKEFDEAIAELQNKYNSVSGIVLLSFNNKLQFSTNHIYGEKVAEILTPLKEKELSRVLLEVLAIIAYKQPITKSEIEEIKITSAEYAIGVLVKTGLIKVIGYKEAVGRPALYATTDEFLKKFQLENIDDLPDYGEVLKRLEELGGFFKPQVELYRDVEIEEEWQRDTSDDAEEQAREERYREIIKSLDDNAIVDEFMENDELPDFLDGEEYETVE